MDVRFIDKAEALDISPESFANDPQNIAVLEKICFSEPWSEKLVRESIAGGHDRFFMLEEPLDNGMQSYGYAAVRVGEDEAELMRICVLPSQRRKGYGAMLLDEVLREAAGRPLFLEVRAGNEAAIALYRSRGFKDIGIRKNYYSAPSEDALVMKKEETDA